MIVDRIFLWLHKYENDFYQIQHEQYVVENVYKDFLKLFVQYRVYDFNEFSNLIALKFQQQDQRLDGGGLEIQELQQKNRELEEKINKLLSLNNINQTTIVL